MESALLARIVEHAKPDDLRRLEVPEWGTDGAPLVVRYKMVTLDDLANVDKLDGANCEWPHKAARIVAMKALDDSGQRLFSTHDAPVLREQAAPDVVNRLALAMLGRMSIEEAEKN